MVIGDQSMILLNGINLNHFVKNPPSTFLAYPGLVDFVWLP